MIPRRKVNSYTGMSTDIVLSFLKGSLLKGASISEFEEAFRRYLKIKNAIAVPSGRFGMELLLKAFHLNKGDEIILPAYTYFVLPKIIINLGYKPVFVDIQIKNYGINPALILQRITPKTKVIIATHLFGMSCDIEEILRIASMYGIEVIEDCAQALGTELISGKKVGTLGNGAFFSFDTTKAINTFGGGIVVTNDDKIADDIRKEVSTLRPSLKKVVLKILYNYIEIISLKRPINNFSLGLIHKKKLYNFIKSFYRKVRGDLAGSQVAFTNIQAIVGLKQLKDLDQYLELRKNLGIKYIKKISCLKNIILNQENIDYLLKNEAVLKEIHLHTFHNLIILIRNAKRISDMLAKYYIDTGAQGEILENCGKIYNPSQRYPVTEFAVENSIELPIFPELKKSEVTYIITILRKILGAEFKSEHSDYSQKWIGCN